MMPVKFRRLRLIAVLVLVAFCWFWSGCHFLAMQGCRSLTGRLFLARSALQAPRSRRLAVSSPQSKTSLQDLTVKELKKRCKELGLHVSGRKAQLVERLSKILSGGSPEMLPLFTHATFPRKAHPRIILGREVKTWARYKTILEHYYGLESAVCKADPGIVALLGGMAGAAVPSAEHVINSECEPRARFMFVTLAGHGTDAESLQCGCENLERVLGWTLLEVAKHYDENNEHIRQAWKADTWPDCLRSWVNVAKGRDMFLEGFGTFDIEEAVGAALDHQELPSVSALRYYGYGTILWRETGEPLPQLSANNHKQLLAQLMDLSADDFRFRYLATYLAWFKGHAQRLARLDELWEAPASEPELPEGCSTKSRPERLLNAVVRQKVLASVELVHFDWLAGLRENVTSVGTLKPVRTSHELVLAARALKNCAGMYSGRIVDKSCFIAVLWQHHRPIAMGEFVARSWRQISQHCNQPAEGQVRQAFENWIPECTKFWRKRNQADAGSRTAEATRPDPVCAVQRPVRAVAVSLVD